MKTLSQDSRSPGQDLNPGPPKYKTGVLSNGPRRSVKAIRFSRSRRTLRGCARCTEKTEGKKPAIQRQEDIGGQ
jgi:hypothetical protein